MARINQKAYTHYVIVFRGGVPVIESGWEYPEDAREHIRGNLPEGLKTKVFTKLGAIRAGFNPNDDTSWLRGWNVEDAAIDRRTTPLDGLEDDAAIDAAIAKFPATFGLRAFPGEVFKIDRRDSFVSGGEIQLYTHIQKDGRWVAFSRGTPFELKREIVRR